MDSQLVELAGRNWLVSQLLRAGLEVARPERDRGIDLLVYTDLDKRLDDFVACPIQMKAASGEQFSVDRKYEKFRRMLLVYVLNLDDSAKTTAYAMTHSEAVAILDVMGVSKNPSWTDKGLWRWPYITPKLREQLVPHAMTMERWREKIISIATRIT
jgi:hypothetical protein